MKPAIGPSLSVQKWLHYVEWMVIVGSVFHYFLLVANGTLHLTAEQFWQLSTFFVTMTAFSWIFPINRSLWIKYTYICLAIAFSLAINYFIGLSGIGFIFLYIAKSCFLFKRKDVAILNAVVGVLYVVIFVWSLPKYTQAFPGIAASINPRDPKIILDYGLNGIAEYIICSSFVIVSCFTILAEQRSRQRAKELSRQVEGLAAQLERTRIARDIHDSLGHTLTNLQVQLALAQEFSQHKLERAFKAIDMAKFLAYRCVEDVSLTLQAMHQSDDFNLNQALQSLMEQFKHHQKLKVHSEINLPQLPLQVNHNLYYIIKEGLTNIQKHAQASRISLRCQATTDRITVILEDNGQGFEPGLSYTGFGLQGMKERVQLLQGKLKIHSTLGTGTQIQVIIPLEVEISSEKV